MTISTATGIKRIQDDKGFGKWFDLLYPLIVSRDSCQPDQAVEPMVEPVTMTESDNTSGTGESLFVPIRGAAKKKDKTSELLLESMLSLKKVIENDPTKDILTLMREDMKQAREQDMQFQQLMLAVLQQQPGVQQPGVHQPVMHQQPRSTVIQSPSVGHHSSPIAHSWPTNTHPRYGNLQHPNFGNNYGIIPNAAMEHGCTSTNMPCPTSEPENDSFTDDGFDGYLLNLK